MKSHHDEGDYPSLVSYHETDATQTGRPGEEHVYSKEMASAPYQLQSEAKLALYKHYGRKKHEMFPTSNAKYLFYQPVKTHFEVKRLV